MLTTTPNAAATATGAGESSGQAGTGPLAPRESALRRRTMGASGKVLVLLLALAAWTAASSLSNSPFLPSPGDTVKAFIDVARNGDVTGISLWTHTVASTVRVLAGFAAGTIVGVPLGIWMGLSPKVWGALRTVLEPLRFIPPIAWIPIAIVLLSGMTRFAFLIFLGTFFPIFIGTLTAVSRVENVHVDVAKIYGAERRWTILHVVIPSILPEVMSSMRVGLGVGWMTIVAAEMAGGTSTGLGVYMINYAQLLRIPEIIVGMAMIALLGFVMNELILLLERRLFKWRWAVSV